MFSSPAVANDGVFVGSNNGTFAEFDANGVRNCSGSPKVCSPLWRMTTGGPVVSSPAVAGGVVYVGSDDRHLYAFAPGWSAFGFGPDHTRFNKTERTLNVGNVTGLTSYATAATGLAVESSPAIADGVVYVGSDDDNFYAFDAGVGPLTCPGSPGVCTPL